MTIRTTSSFTEDPVPTKTGGSWENDGYDLITTTTYNARGLVDTTTTINDSQNQVTKYVYDDLNRRVAIVENRTNFDEEEDFAWSNSLDRWTVLGGLTQPDVDRVTSFVYDGLGNVEKQVAHRPGGPAGSEANVQVTEYVFEVDTNTIGNPLASDLWSNDLLGQVVYPDLETGENNDDRSVFFAYNRQGEVISMRDQNGTQHDYLRDPMGRVELDNVVFEPESDIDQTIKAIGTRYDDAGRVEYVTSYSAYTDPNNNVPANEVKFTYTPLWQIEHIYQDHDDVVEIDGMGEPLGNTVRVTYAYDTEDAGQGNFSRVLNLFYPDGASVYYQYSGYGSATNHWISRLERMTLQEDVRYEYVGLSMFAVVDFAKVDVQLDRTATHEGERNWEGYDDHPGEYPGLDRFGRVVRHMWVDGDFTAHEPVSQNPVIPPIVELTYTYDRASNRLTAYNENPTLDDPTLGWKNRDFQYYPDGLHRLQEAKRGRSLPMSWSPASGSTASQYWDLDMLSNWQSVWNDQDGSDTYEYSEQEDRNHNVANEIEDRDPDGPGGSMPLALEYDKAGNLVHEPVRNDLRYTYDAWNRLVTLATGALAIDRARYQYNRLELAHRQAGQPSRWPRLG